MKVYCVITETEQGVDLAGVYGNLKSAVEHVKRRFHSVFQEYINNGYEMIEGENYTPPSDYGAEIYLDSNDFWIWRIDSGEVRNECLQSGLDKVAPLPLEEKHVDGETLMNCLLL